MTLWQTVTGNSTLPVQAGVNFWDHLNNQDGGGGFGSQQLVVVEAFVNMDAQQIEATAETSVVEVDIEVVDYDFSLENSILVDAVVDRTELT